MTYVREFEVGGIKCRCAKMPALTQFNVPRRAGLALPSAREFLEGACSGKGVAGLLGRAMKAMAAMSGGDTTYIFVERLSTYQRSNGKREPVADLKQGRRPGWAGCAALAGRTMSVPRAD